MAAGPHQSFSQSSLLVPFNLLPKAQPYTFQDNIGSTTVTVNVTPITSSCSIFRNELDAITHYFGHTYFSYSSNVDWKTPIEQTKFACSCTNTVYNDINTCQKECVVSLGCFVGICQPTEHLICRTAVARCEGPHLDSITVAWWEPTDPADHKPECKAEATAVNSAILAHEEAHVNSMAEYASSIPAQEKRVTSCDTTIEKVDAENIEKIKFLLEQCDRDLNNGYSTYPANPDVSGAANPFKGALSHMSCTGCP